MKKFLLLATLICCSFAFAQDVVTDTTKVAEPAEVPADTVVVDIAATDTAKVAEPAEAPADTTASVIPASEPESPAVDTAATDTAKVAASTEQGRSEPAEAPADTVVAAPAPTAIDTTAVDTTASVIPASACPGPSSGKPESPVADSLKKWTHFIGVGITAPVAQYKVDHKKTDLVNYGVALSYMGIHRSGFTTRLSVAAGGSVTDNIQFDGSDDWQIGGFGSAEIGLGISFVNGRRATLAVLAVAGFEYAVFETEEEKFVHEDLGRVDRSFEESLGALTLGGDIVLRLGLSDHVGLWASVGGRWVAVTVAESVVRYNKEDYTRTESFVNDGSGVYSIVPALGVMWNF